MNEHHYSFTTAVTGIRKAGTILVWDAGLISRDVRSKAGDILAAVQNGARLVIMEQEKWDWDELADFSIHEPYGKSRAFIFDEAKDDPLFRNTGPEYFLRWNGIPFSVAEREIKGPFIDHAEKLIWAERPEIIYAVKQDSGKGEILISGLLIKKHIQKLGRDYDPVAEQLLFNFSEIDAGWRMLRSEPEFNVKLLQSVITEKYLVFPGIYALGSFLSEYTKPSSGRPEIAYCTLQNNNVALDQ